MKVEAIVIARLCQVDDVRHRDGNPVEVELDFEGSHARGERCHRVLHIFVDRTFGFAACTTHALAMVAMMFGVPRAMVSPSFRTFPSPT